jgi:hypothetical protein
MRRLSHFRDTSRAIVAIYDALLFLMVVILISEGMFLYTATVSDGGGGFSDDHYQHLTDTGRIMVEALSLNESHPMPMVAWSNATHNETRPLDYWVGPSEADTVRWLLESYIEITVWNEHDNVTRNGEYDTSEILPVVDSIFSENRLVGTDHAWLFLYEGEVQLFGSNAVESVEDLPEDRWASVANYTLNIEITKGIFIQPEAELRYYLWLQ